MISLRVTVTCPTSAHVAVIVKLFFYYFCSIVLKEISLEYIVSLKLASKPSSPF